MPSFLLPTGPDRTRELAQPDLQPDFEAERQGAQDPEDLRQLWPAVLQWRERLQQLRPGL